MATKFAYNRVLKKADYKKFGVNHRKGWEIEMAMKTLGDFGAIHPEAEILGVGAAKETTIYKLSRDVKRVWATDLYLDMGDWSKWAGADFLIDPSTLAPAGVAFNRNRIIPMHMDMCQLRFEDNTFDAVFSSGSIEHVGTPNMPDWKAIAQAAKEIGRVVKPGGIVSLSTEWKIAGDGWGWGHVRLFDEALLMEHLVAASGCELIGVPDWTFDAPLDEYVVLYDIVHKGAKEDGFALLKEYQFLYTSVHLALRKPA